MIPITVYLQTPDEGEPYRQLFQQQFYEVPAVGSLVRVFVADRVEVYVVQEIYHDFRSGPQGPSPLPISIVVTTPNTDSPKEAEARAHSEIDGAWGSEFQGFARETNSPRLG